MNIYDAYADRMLNVADSTLTHAEFCDYARQAWDFLRVRLRLPVAEPVFWWEEVAEYQAQTVGQTCRAGEDWIVLSHQDSATFTTDDFGAQLESLLEFIVTRSGGTPTVFGRLPIPQIYYGLALTTPVDTFSLRLLHFYSTNPEHEGWMSRLDVLHSVAPESRNLTPA